MVFTENRRIICAVFYYTMTTSTSSLPQSIRYGIRGLSRGVHPVSLEAKAELLDMPPFVGKIDISGEVEVSEYFHFRLNLKGTAEVICDRCAKQFEKIVETDIDVIFTPEGMANPVEDALEVFTYDPHGAQSLDLAEVVRDHLLLGIPMRNLCEEDCVGIETERWEPEESQNKALLRSLYDKLRDQEMNDGPK
jgi:uncharacterized metal-binding protein YceD (DUF177 family)